MPRAPDEHRRRRGQKPNAAIALRAAKHPVGRVVGLHRGQVDVLVDGEELPAVYGGQMRGEQVVVGDQVRVRMPRHAQDTARVVDRLERATVLLRTADDTVNEERVVVANADLAVVVIPVDQTDASARLADRILIAASAGGLNAAICVTKTDLDAGATDFERRYRALGYPVLSTSTVSGQGLDELRDLLVGQWSVLAGHSGVGKSSLMNCLVPGANRQVGELGRFGGRHTTVSPRALRVPDSPDTWLVDTPGIRSFGIAHIPVEELPWHFPELRDLPCELPDCLHDGEPGCAVAPAMGDTVHADRYASYLRFLVALREQQW